MASALGEVARAADRVAAEQLEVAKRARVMQRRRQRGWSWTDVFETDDGPALVALLRRSASHLRAVTGRFIEAVVGALAEEGQSRRAIASKVGMSHQRVSRLVRRSDAPQSETDE
jgi:hypothetical protein